MSSFNYTNGSTITDGTVTWTVRKVMVEGQGGSGGSGSVSWSDISGKPSTFPPSSHNHNDLYYTETEIDTKLSGKSDTNHTHNYAASSHTHDDRYYTESEVNSLMSGKADAGHTHSQYLTSHNPVDSTLSASSTNAVQNKVVNSALGNKANVASPTFTGTVTAPTLTVTTTLNIPGGQIWIE